MAQGNGWRAMRRWDLTDVARVAAKVHPELPESVEVFAERLRLFAAGCLVLEHGGCVVGYAVSHPISTESPPALNALLGEIPAGADQFYIHDIAVLPEARGAGQASEGIEMLLRVAERYRSAALVSVYGTSDFWGRFGFTPAAADMTAKLAPYGADAVYMVRQAA